MANPSVHKGHRERLKARFLETGLDSFTDVQALELLLFYAIPQKDTNPIAHALLDRFGSLSQVLDAPLEALKKVPGISDHSASLLRLVTELARFYQVDSAQRTEVLTSLDACGRYLVPRFFGRKVETVFLLCLDAKCKVLCCREIGEGSVNAASISVRKVVEAALSANATSVVLAHNHPSGVALPSADDVQTTRRIAAALSAVEVKLIDHIVVAEGDFISMAQSGYRFDEYLLP
ncbi:MAG: DNA repair protein RadC [Candidatus Faecousia sp.]|nr:DNA repair protein RadC [Candidatus Faecousia sp.]